MNILALSFVFLFSISNFASDNMESYLRLKKSYESEVQFQKDLAVNDSVEQRTYIWFSKNNTVIHRTLLTPHNYSQYVNSGEPISQYLNAWAFAIQVKRLFQLEEQVSVIEKKLKAFENDPSRGGDYYIELADLLKEVVQLPRSNEYISKDGVGSSTMSTAQSLLLMDIASLIYRAHSTKKSSIYMLFWNRINEIRLEVPVTSYIPLAPKFSTFFPNSEKSLSLMNEFWLSLHPKEIPTFGVRNVLACKDFF